MNILIIEKNTENLKKLRGILSREGFGIITVSDRESAVNICEKMEIDFILAEKSNMDLTKFEENYQNKID